MKIVFRIGLVTLSIIFLGIYFIFQNYLRHSGLAEIHVLNVGQGDSILLVSPEEHQILIDGGPGDKILSLLPWYLPYQDQHLDALILTHPHADHLEGLIHVLHHYQVDFIFINQAVYESDLYEEWLELLQDFSGEIILVEKNKEIHFGTLKFKFLYPYHPDEFVAGENINNASIIFTLTELKTGRTAFFSGDAELEVEEDILKNIPPQDLQAEFFKAGHHGSETSNSLALLEQIQPEIVAISSGEANSYGHPHSQSLSHFEKIGSHVYRTDTDGDLSFYDLSSIEKCGESWHLKTAVEVLKIRIRDQCN